MNTILKLVLNYVLARLKEPSTWRGLFLFLAAHGVQLNTEQATLLVSLALTAAGAIGAFLPDSFRAELPKTYAEYPNDQKPPVSQGPSNSNINKSDDGDHG